MRQWGRKRCLRRVNDFSVCHREQPARALKLAHPPTVEDLADNVDLVTSLETQLVRGPGSEVVQRDHALTFSLSFPPSLCLSPSFENDLSRRAGSLGKAEGSPGTDERRLCGGFATPNSSVSPKSLSSSANLSLVEFFSLSLSSFSLGAMATVSKRFRDARDRARDGGLLSAASDFLRESDFFRKIAGYCSSSLDWAASSATYLFSEFDERIDPVREAGVERGVDRALGAPSFFTVSLRSYTQQGDPAGVMRTRTHRPIRT